MLYEGNLRLSNKKKANIQVDDFAGGVNTLFSATRLKKNEAYEATNLILIEDGVWDKRWGTQIYPVSGTTFTNRPDGFSEYRKTDGTRELIVVADGVVIRVGEDGTKTTISGATFTQGTPCEFLQINNYLYICNGVDDLARYDGSTLATYTALAAPAWAGTPLARGGGLSAGSFTYYYRVTAVNSVGETTPNAEQSITANIARADWDAANESITLDWDAVSGALKYIVYFSDTSGFEVKLAEVEGGSTGYIDLGGGGVDIPNPYVEPPTDNTTDGPKFSTIALSGNRIWGAKNPDAPWRVYFSGTGVNLGNFSPAYGGGWIDLEKGGRATTEKPVDYQGKAHILCKTDDGKGTIWQISLDSISIDTETFTVPIPTKIITSIGTPAPRSVIYVENDVMFFNPKGVHVLGNEPGVLNVLRTNELTAKIRPYVRGLNAASLDKICAYYFNSKVLFAVPSGEGYPDRIIMFDRERVSWIKTGRLEYHSLENTQTQAGQPTYSALRKIDW